jgi:quercetin dioxygenase-like cupin family protein
MEKRKLALERIEFGKAVHVAKGWGKEIQVASFKSEEYDRFPTGYSGKLLVYERDNAVSSMHCHGDKHETFYVLSGEFTFRWLEPETANLKTKTLREGDAVVIPPLNQHQVICVKAGTILEVASHDKASDNYRVYKGDSQKT